MKSMSLLSKILSCMSLGLGLLCQCLEVVLLRICLRIRLLDVLLCGWIRDDRSSRSAASCSDSIVL